MPFSPTTDLQTMTDASEDNAGFAFNTTATNEVVTPFSEEYFFLN